MSLNIVVLLAVAAALPADLNRDLDYCLQLCFMEQGCNAVEFLPSSGDCYFERGNETFIGFQGMPAVDGKNETTSEEARGENMTTPGLRSYRDERGYTIKLGGDVFYSGDGIYLKAKCRGHYLQKSAASIWGGWTLAAVHGDRRPEAKFTVEVVSDNSISLITDNGQYVNLYLYDDQALTTDPRLTGARGPPFVVEHYRSSILLRTVHEDPSPKQDYLYDCTGCDEKVYFSCRRWHDDCTVFCNPYYYPEKAEKGDRIVSEAVSNFNFDLSKATRHDMPVTIYEQCIGNDTPTPQTHTIEFDETISTEKTMSWESGFALTISTSFTIGVPLASSTTTVTATTHFTKGGSKSDTDTKTFKDSQPVTAPAHTNVLAQAVTMKGTLDVPFTASYERVIKEPDGGTVKYKYGQISGTFRGVNTYGYSVKIKVVDSCP